MAILRSFGKAVELLASGAVDPGPLLGEPLPLEHFGEAVSQVRAGNGIKSAHQANINRAARAMTGGARANR